jgi:hypothetical protein
MLRNIFDFLVSIPNKWIQSFGEKGIARRPKDIYTLNHVYNKNSGLSLARLDATIHYYFLNFLVKKN